MNDVSTLQNSQGTLRQAESKPKLTAIPPVIVMTGSYLLSGLTDLRPNGQVVFGLSDYATRPANRQAALDDLKKNAEAAGIRYVCGVRLEEQERNGLYSCIAQGDAFEYDPRQEPEPVKVTTEAPAAQQPAPQPVIAPPAQKLPPAMPVAPRPVPTPCPPQKSDFQTFYDDLWVEAQYELRFCRSMEEVLSYNKFTTRANPRFMAALVTRLMAHGYDMPDEWAPRVTTDAIDKFEDKRRWIWRATALDKSTTHNWQEFIKFLGEHPDPDAELAPLYRHREMNWAGYMCRRMSMYAPNQMADAWHLRKRIQEFTGYLLPEPVERPAKSTRNREIEEANVN